jgi:hypothetical protein
MHAVVFNVLMLGCSMGYDSVDLFVFCFFGTKVRYLEVSCFTYIPSSGPRSFVFSYCSGHGTNTRHLAETS